MSCGEEVEAILDSVGSYLKGCTVAIYNIHEGFSADDIEVMCDVRGAKARVFTVSSISRSIGMDHQDMLIFLPFTVLQFIGSVFVGTCEQMVIAWWGASAIPQGHILVGKMNSIICHPAEEDTVISSLQCTGWIKVLLASNPQCVADVYSESGESQSDLGKMVDCFAYTVM